MTYAVREVFYTMQGEGAQAGRPAVFIRMAGCNLWTGLEKDRGNGAGGCSAWCDTEFVGLGGVRGGCYTAVQLAEVANSCWPTPGDGRRKYVVVTGGEPLLQLDGALVDALHAQEFDVAVETNGTRVPPAGVDWVCVSPKLGGALELRRGNELKLVFPQKGVDPADFVDLPFSHFFLQPMDGPDREANTAAARDYCLANPRWRLSLQLHKVLGIP